MIKKRLNELMEDSKINPEQLSNKLKLSGNAIVYDWLNEKYLPNYENIIKLADYFCCSIDYLLGLTENNSEVKFKQTPPFDLQLKKVMALKKTTQYKMIKDEVVHKSYFNKCFTIKHQPKIDTLIKLSNYFKISIDELVGRV